jgi:hypothetical protein
MEWRKKISLDDGVKRIAVVGSERSRSLYPPIQTLRPLVEGGREGGMEG